MQVDDSPLGSSVKSGLRAVVNAAFRVSNDLSVQEELLMAIAKALLHHMPEEFDICLAIKEHFLVVLSALTCSVF